MDKLERALEKARLNRQRSEFAPEMTARQSGVPSISIDSASSSSTMREDVLEANRIFARRAGSRPADLFRILRTKVQQLCATNGLFSIGITSPNYGDGKTTIAANLALSLALDIKQSVCLVDLDLRDPKLHTVLGLKAEKGLSDYLLGNAPLTECLVRPAYDRLLVLPNCRPFQNSSEMLSNPKMAALARELKSRYADRLVIYDLPPVLPTDDTIGFLPHLDGVVLVLREGVTAVEDLQRCLHTLGKTTLLGTVLNKSHWRDGRTVTSDRLKPWRIPSLRRTAVAS